MELYLGQNSVATHRPFEIHTEMVLRIVCVTSQEFSTLRDWDGISRCSNFLYQVSRTPTVELPGVCVSCWKPCQPIDFFTMDDLVLSSSIYGKGHGDRHICANVGGNLYEAERRSTQQSPNPEHGRGPNLLFSHYTRKDWCCSERQFRLAAKIRNSATRTVGLFDDIFDNFLTFIRPKTSSLFIWTYGSKDGGHRIVRKTSEGNQRPKYKVCRDRVLNFLGFANTPHVDGDQMRESDSDRWMNGLATGSTIHNYVGKIRSMFGLGVQTTCGYNVVTDSIANQDHLLAYFCQGQFAVPIRDCSAHLFFGWAIPHCTAIPVVHLDGCYHVNNDDLEDPVLIGGWGSGSNGGGQYDEPNIANGDGRGDRNFHPDQLQNVPGQDDQDAIHQYNLDGGFEGVSHHELEELTQDAEVFLGEDADDFLGDINGH